MFKTLTIGSKIAALVLTIVSIAIIGLSIISFKFSQSALKSNYSESINTLADLKTARIKAYFDNISHIISVMQKLPVLQTAGQTPSAPESSLASDSASTSSSDGLASALTSSQGMNTDAVASAFAPFKNAFKIENIYIVSIGKKVLFNQNPSDQRDLAGDNFYDTDGSVIESGKDSIYFSSIYQNTIMVSAPIKDQSGLTKAILVCKIMIDQVYTLTQDTLGLGSTGEIIIARLYQANKKIIFQNSLRHKRSTALRQEVILGELSNKPIQYAVEQKSGFGDDIDYRKKRVLAVWRYLPGINWGMVVKIDYDEINESSQSLLKIFVLAGLVILIITAILTVIFSSILTKPLSVLKQSMDQLGRGVLPANIALYSKDEIGQITTIVNSLVGGLKRTANFAHQIGEGDFAADYTPLSEEDTLGIALLNMRNSLQDASKRDEERNWIVRGVAEIGEILRRHTEATALGEDITAFITQKTGAIQGAFYTVENEENSAAYIQMRASFAYGKKKYLKSKFNFGEGLVGQVAIEQDLIERTEIPDEYLTVTSGLLGEQKPSALLIVPLITNEQVLGIIEFASFQRFSAMHVKFVQEVSQIIARTIFNIQVNERTKNLLGASQKMSFELQQQQEELRQNAEEMAATQEELTRSNIQLEEQIEEVNLTQKRMQVLLENASEVITIYETDAVVRYVSPSVEKILGYKPAEMIGIKDLQFIHPDGRPTFEKMFQTLLNDPDHAVAVQFSYKQKNGSQIWLEAKGTNLLDDPAIAGIVINSRDITERRMAEQESRMRGQMQALSENSPDLITRLNKKGDFFYINPVIEEYSGQDPTRFLQKNIYSDEFDTGIFQAWRTIIEMVVEQQTKVATEIDFNSHMGNRVMQVNAIPEYNEEQKLESVLLVSHDITDRKLIELEIQSKNKKITESINYAKRIQVAILPDSNTIHEAFEDSFILYKPRDVVSGDFPWFMSKGDDVYVAVVDCTGHGVPGALISLIGYFLLNNILKDVSSPSEILDFLDAAVTKTLKQDGGDNSTRDGMDIALCKINRKLGTLEFSGAHRPIYYYNLEGEMTEIKGDKFPIGGGQYKNRSAFVNHVITYKPGESVLFFSDGFPDQFGGGQNRKFSSRRIKDLYTQHGSRPMQEINQIYDDAFEEWKADEKQTDDVLMIGIRL